MSVPATVPGVYAQALVDLAEEQGLYAAIIEEAQVVQQVCAALPEMMATFQSGGLSRDGSRKLVGDLFASHCSPLMVDFVSLLSDRGRMAALPAICERVQALDEERRGVVRVTAITATEADAEVKATITATLRRQVSEGAIVTWTVDDSLVAGMCLRFQDIQIDGSARRRLADAREVIRQAPLAVVDTSGDEVQA